MSPVDIDPDREHRVTTRGEAFALQARDLAASSWPAGDPNVIAEACEYLVEAIIQFAIRHQDPQPVLDLVIDDLSNIDAKQLRDRAIAKLRAKTPPPKEPQ